jgi:hypothetical protein
MRLAMGKGIPARPGIVPPQNIALERSVAAGAAGAR